MDLTYYIQSFSNNKRIFESLLSKLSSKEILWKPSPEKWCPLEIICHLFDEEVEDFRTRVHHVLETPDHTPPPVNPVQWVTERDYLNQDFHQKLNAFLLERENSILWLKSLKQPSWDNAYLHPKLGPMTAKYFLVNWLAHDQLHIKQILRLKYDYLRTVSGENLEYAGQWL